MRVPAPGGAVAFLNLQVRLRDRSVIRSGTERLPWRASGRGFGRTRPRRAPIGVPPLKASSGAGGSDGAERGETQASRKGEAEETTTGGRGLKGRAGTPKGVKLTGALSGSVVV